MKRFVIKIKKVADLLFSFRLSRKKDLCLSIWKLRISHGSFTTWWPAETATAARTLAASAASAHSGTKFQKSAKIRISVDLTCAWKSLTDFENEANDMTENYFCRSAETYLEKTNFCGFNFCGFDFQDLQFTAVYNYILFSFPLVQWNLDLRKILGVNKIFLKSRFFLISNLYK